MSRRDIYHNAVRNALIKDGWTITHDPLVLAFGRRNIYVDIGAESPLGAEKDGVKIAVEIKSFVGASEITELERALGQYALYHFLLARREPERMLYLAVPAASYESILSEPEGHDLAVAQALRILVFDPDKEVVTQWIK